MFKMNCLMLRYGLKLHMFPSSGLSTIYKFRLREVFLKIKLFFFKIESVF